MTPSTPTTARGSAPAPSAARDAERRSPPEERDVADFERALRQRARPRDKGPGGDGGRGSDGEQPPPFPDAAFAALQPAPGLPAPPIALTLALAKADIVEAPAPARGLVEPPPAALQANLTFPTAPGTQDTARAFEISLREPLGGALTLQAVPPVAGAGWALSVGAHGLNPPELRRNLGRLEERLRAKGLSHEPLSVHDHAADSEHHHHPSEDLP